MPEIARPTNASPGLGLCLEYAALQVPKFDRRRSFGDWSVQVELGKMAFYAAPLGGLPSRRWSDIIVFASAVVAVSLGAAAWISDSDQTAIASAALSQATEHISFEDRFQASFRSRMPRIVGAMPLDRPTFAVEEINLRAAKSLLSQRLLSRDWRADLGDQPRTDAAAWISDSDRTTIASAALPQATEHISFEDRLLQASSPSRMPRIVGAMPLDRPAFAVEEMNLRAAITLPSQRLPSRDWRADLGDLESKLTPTASLPLPRSRPAAADLASEPGPLSAFAHNSAMADDRTLLQKLSDLLPRRLTLASLAPDGGLFSRGPDLASLGFEAFTAVYDISARTVYLPNGMSLEAHSGMGNLRDDPEHVSVPKAGATPPAVYELKLRESLFHGVQALRMIPVAGSDISGRSGLLAHSFMLGPNGDSNGCVSIKDYDRFLKAFNAGEINRLVVVPSLSSIKLVSQSATQS